MKNLKRALSLVLSTAMMVGMMVVGTGAADFTDAKGHDNEEAIELMAMIGVMEGDGENFNPDNIVTRNEMAVVMCNLLDLKLNGYHNFTDVADWADDYVGALYTNGYTAGKSATLYGGADQITTAEAALMIMRTLGYFEFQGEFGGDWLMATVKRATELDLFKDIDAGVKEPLTRGEVAQMVLNALDEDVVNMYEYNGLKVEGNGITVSTSASYEDRPIGKTLAQKLYDGKLTPDFTAEDAYGRPAVKWTYTGNGEVESVTVAEKAVVVFTAETKAVDVKKAVKAYNLPEIEDENGEAVDVNALIADMTGNGKRVEIFADDETLDVIDIVVIEEHIGKIVSVTKADEAKDIKRSVKVDGKNFETENFAKKDMVIYTLNLEGNIETMELAEKVTGKVTATPSDDSYIKIDGVSYKYAAAFDETVPSLNSTVELYVDSYGYIIGLGDEIKSVAAVKDYVVVTAVGEDGFENTQIKVLKADGTTAVLSVEQRGESLDVADIVKSYDEGTYTFYTIKDSDADGNYEFFEAVTDQDSETGKYAGYDAHIDDVDVNDEKDKLDNGYALADEAVVFNYNTVEAKWTVTTGAKLAKVNIATVITGYANKAADGFFAVELAVAESTLSSASDYVYGYITAKTEDVVNADDETVSSVTFWNGVETVVALVDGTTELTKGDFIQFKLNEKGEMTNVSELNDVAYISAFNGEVINFNGDTENSYDVDEDTVVIYVDSDADVVAGAEDGEIALADKDENDNYVDNAIYVVDSEGDVLVLFVDVNGKIVLTETEA